MFEKKAKKIIRDYCNDKYPRRLEVVANDRLRPLFNNRCQMNAEAAVEQKDAVAVIECVMIDEDGATLHYVNLGHDMSVFDCTLGPRYVSSDYRLIEVFRDFPNGMANDRLVTMKEKIAKAALPKWLFSLTKPAELL